MRLASSANLLEEEQKVEFLRTEEKKKTAADTSPRSLDIRDADGGHGRRRSGSIEGGGAQEDASVVLLDVIDNRHRAGRNAPPIVGGEPCGHRAGYPRNGKSPGRRARSRGGTFVSLEAR